MHCTRTRTATRHQCCWSDFAEQLQHCTSQYVCMYTRRSTRLLSLPESATFCRLSPPSARFCSVSENARFSSKFCRHYPPTPTCNACSLCGVQCMLIICWLRVHSSTSISSENKFLKETMKKGDGAGLFLYNLTTLLQPHLAIVIKVRTPLFLASSCNRIQPLARYHQHSNISAMCHLQGMKKT